jgi:hypothetical protein
VQVARSKCSYVKRLVLTRALQQSGRQVACTAVLCGIVIRKQEPRARLSPYRSAPVNLLCGFIAV